MYHASHVPSCPVRLPAAQVPNHERAATNMTKCPAVERTPGKISGAWAFTGTRVPVYALFENLESGATVKEFLEWYPDVEEWQVRAVLDHEVEQLKTPALP